MVDCSMVEILTHFLHNPCTQLCAASFALPALHWPRYWEIQGRGGVTTLVPVVTLEIPLMTMRGKWPVQYFAQMTEHLTGYLTVITIKTREFARTIKAGLERLVL